MSSIDGIRRMKENLNYTQTYKDIDSSDWQIFKFTLYYVQNHTLNIQQGDSYE